MTRSLFTLIASVALLAAACAPAASTGTGGQDAGEFPVTIQAPNGPVTIAERPTSIVSLSPTATEVLFAIEAGNQVVAVDDQSDYPAQAPMTDLTGLEPNIEAIAGLDADLVVMMFDVGGETVAALEAIGIPTIVHGAATDLEDAYRQIEQLGAATGNIGAAANLIASMRTDIERVVAETDAGGATYYHELDPFLYAPTSQTFVGALYSMVGLVNIADPADDGTGYPQLSPELIVDVDPDFVFLADTKCCDQSAAVVAERPGWSTLTAVIDGRVFELDDDIASRWGPRVVEFMEAVAAAVESGSGA